MNLQLDEVCGHWNTHKIRHARTPTQNTAVPDELYYIPELRDTYLAIVLRFMTFSIIDRFQTLQVCCRDL